MHLGLADKIEISREHLLLNCMMDNNLAFKLRVRSEEGGSVVVRSRETKPCSPFFAAPLATFTASVTASAVLAAASASAPPEMMSVPPRIAACPTSTPRNSLPCLAARLDDRRQLAWQRRSWPIQPACSG